MTLQKGSSGIEVIALQNALNASASGPRIGVDGSFGPATESKLKNYQAIHGIPATGIADARTLKELGIATSRPSSSSSFPTPSTLHPYMAVGIIAAIGVAAIIYKKSKG